MFTTHAGCPCCCDEARQRCSGREKSGYDRLLALFVRSLAHAPLRGFLHALRAGIRLIDPLLCVRFRQPSLTRNDLRQVGTVAAIERSLCQSDRKDATGLRDQCGVVPVLRGKRRGGAGRGRLRSEKSVCNI